MSSISPTRSLSSRDVDDDMGDGPPPSTTTPLCVGTTKVDGSATLRNPLCTIFCTTEDEDEYDIPHFSLNNDIGLRNGDESRLPQDEAGRDPHISQGAVQDNVLSKQEGKEGCFFLRYISITIPRTWNPSETSP
jgi:hypothetical protein